jgi:hypothetical protein
MTCALPYDIHEMIIAKYIRSYADFARYLNLVNNIGEARLLYAKFADDFTNNTNDVKLFAFCADHLNLTDYPIKLRINRNDIIIPFSANVRSLVIDTTTFNPEIYIHYAHIKEIAFINWHFNIDCKVVAKTFPNLRRIQANIEFIARIVDHMPKLIRVYTEPKIYTNLDFIKKHREIEFIFRLHSALPDYSNEPNIKIRAQVDSDRIDRIAHLAYKIINLTIIVNQEYGELYISEAFREVTYLTILNNRYNDIVISGFPNLDTISIYSRPQDMGFITLRNLPYLNKVISIIQ